MTENEAIRQQAMEELEREATAKGRQSLIMFQAAQRLIERGRIKKKNRDYVTT